MYYDKNQQERPPKVQRSFGSLAVLWMIVEYRLNTKFTEC